MAYTAYNTQSAEPHLGTKTLARGYVFGAPIGELGWFACLLMSIAIGMAAFFLGTFLAIMTVLFLNAGGRHHIDFAMTYRWIGIPAGVTVLLLSLAYLGTFWAKRVFRKA